ncbi:MAG: oxidoreductase protein [Armatimonadetes bacterium]|jgi:predicted dehydrogenase|nr:oxidoreductase protein [Armatimonadota bacterium]
MSKPLRIGVLGAGSIGIRGALVHLAVGDFADRVVPAAVCDTVPGRAKAAAERFGVPQWFESYEEMLAAGDIDSITVCTPIAQHYEQGLRAIEAGKHLHFNKTMTTTVAEADDLIARAETAGVKLVSSPGQMLRPHLWRIRELLQDGALGQLAWAATGAGFGTYHETEPVRQGDGPLYNSNPAWYWTRAGAGGPVYDMTVYGLHALTGILGPAKRVTALSGSLLKEREFRGEAYACDCDDNTMMLLDFGGAVFAFVYGTAAGSIVASFGSPSFYGTRGSIVAELLNGEPFDFPGREAQAAAGINAALPDYNERHPTEEFHVFEDLLQLAAVVGEGKPTVSTAEHARHVIDIIESGYRSAETGAAQTLRTAFQPA